MCSTMCLIPILVNWASLGYHSGSEKPPSSQVAQIDRADFFILGKGVYHLKPALGQVLSISGTTENCSLRIPAISPSIQPPDSCALSLIHWLVASFSLIELCIPAISPLYSHLTHVPYHWSIGWLLLSPLLEYKLKVMVASPGQYVQSKFLPIISQALLGT